MVKIPYLSIIEKKFICFQMIYSLDQIYNKNLFCHGDIKPENILLGPKLTTFLSDISTPKPIRIKKNDTRTYNAYFSNNDSCYLAPERFDEDISTNISIDMDIFSLGVVFAEIFLGNKLFTVNDIIDYKYDGNLKKKLRQIGDYDLENLIYEMLNKVPTKRKSIKNILNYFTNELCPSPLSGFIIYINFMIINHEYHNDDLLIALIWKHFKQIWKVLFFQKDKEINPPQIYHQPNKIICNLLNTKVSIYNIGLENYSLLFISSKNDCMIDIQKIKNYQDSSDCNFIIIRYLINSLFNTKYPSSITLAIELIEKFSSKLDDNSKIQLIIPYLISLFSIENTLVKKGAYNSILNILLSINEDNLILNQMDLHSFTYYIVDNIIKLYHNSDILIKILIINSIDILIHLEEKFLYCSINSQKVTTVSETNKLNQSVLSSFIFNINQNIKNKENKEGKIDIEKYEEELKDFKEMLFKLIDDVFTRNDKGVENLQLVVLKKYKEILLFYGHNDSKIFMNYLFILFNKDNFLLQKEILKLFPSLIMMYGENIFSTYYLPEIEGIFNKKNNEMLFIELIHSMNLISKADLISKKDQIELFHKTFIFLLHPNFQIRKEIVEFGIGLVKKIPSHLIYCFLRENIKKIYDFPVLIISSDEIKKICERFIHRDEFIFYEKNINYQIEEKKIKILKQLVNQTKVLGNNYKN